MKLSNQQLVSAAALVSLLALTVLYAARAVKRSAALQGVVLPAEYRDWKLISVSNVGAPFDDLRAKLGNDAAIQAYRTGTLPFPEGAMIVRIAWRQATSTDNDKAFSILRPLDPPTHSLVAGPATNIQLMLKDSKKYSSTGGWGFFQFTGGTPASEVVHKTCFPCHKPIALHDYVFTRYAP